jgi:hypothetical protein
MVKQPPFVSTQAAEMVKFSEFEFPSRISVAIELFADQVTQKKCHKPSNGRVTVDFATEEFAVIHTELNRKSIHHVSETKCLLGVSLQMLYLPVFTTLTQSSYLLSPIASFPTRTDHSLPLAGVE